MELTKKGMECGEEIAKILREMGHEIVFPLYRMAVIVEHEEDCLRLRFFGDPHAEGKDITPENIREMETVVEFYGDRFCPHMRVVKGCADVSEKDGCVTVDDRIFEREAEFRRLIEEVKMFQK